MCGRGWRTRFDPLGEYVTGPLFLRSDLELRLEAGATLLGREEFGAYPVIEDLSFVDGSVSDADRGVRAEGVGGMYLRNVSVDAAEGPAFDLARIGGLELERVADPDPDPDPGVPVVSLSESDALIRSCAPAEGTETFVERDNSEAVLLANHFANADRDVA